MRTAAAVLLASLPLLLAACRERTEAPAAPAAPAAKPVPELWQRVVKAMDVDSWRRLGRLSFTWKHLPSGRERRYVWRIPERTVEITTKGPDGALLKETVSTAAASGSNGHKGFVNDLYWFAFPLVALDDGCTLRDLGEVEVPGLPHLDTLRALEAAYPADEGYTGGDRYVLYIGADDLPVAWAFHRGGAAEPTLVTTREARRRICGVSLPMRFVRADGTAFIEIDDATAEYRR